MVFLVTALTLEASPIIRHFRLKKDMSSGAFPVFRGGNLALAVSGTGKMKSAMAVVYLKSLFPQSKNDCLINIGFCGSTCQSLEPGEMALFHKITDRDTGRDYYPDLFYDWGLPRAELSCHSRPVTLNDAELLFKGNLPDTFFCDMESAGIMEAGKKFFYAHRLVILKIISDRLQPEDLNKELLTGYMTSKLPVLEAVVKSLQEESGTDFEKESETDTLLEKLAQRYRFTAAMTEKLGAAIRRVRLMGGRPEALLADFLPDKETNSKTKGEGKLIYGRIIGRLEEGAL